MNKKQLIGIVIFAIGIIMILFSMHVTSLIDQGVSDAEQTKEAWTSNPLNPLSSTPVVNEAIESRWQSEIDSQSGQYYSKAQLIWYGGIALAIIGGFIAICCRRSRR